MARSLGFEVSNTKKIPEMEKDELGLTPTQKAVLMQRIAKQDEQFEAGEGIPSEEVYAWLRSLGTAKPLPTPQRKSSRT